MNGVHPVIRHLILCDNVLVGGGQPSRITIVGLLHAIAPEEAPAYPHLRDEFCVFVQLSSYRGPGTCRLEIQQADTDQCVFRSPDHPLPPRSDPLGVHGISFRVVGCVIPAAGLYWVQFWYNDTMLAQQPLLLR